MVPEMEGVTESNFCNFGPFFYPFSPMMTTQKIKILKLKKTPGNIIILHICTINDIHMTHGSWDMECNKQSFLSFWTVFCPFYPLNNPKNQNFGKMKHTPKDITILHRCTINDNHMMYLSYEILSTTDRTFCHFGLFFAILPL